MKRLKTKVLFLLALIVILFFAVYPVLDACGVGASCGAWCETFGDCQGHEMCHANANSATCTCGTTTVTFTCPPAR